MNDLTPRLFCLLDSTDSEPNTSRPVNVNEKYYVVMKGNFEDHGLLFCGETDAMDPQRLIHDRNDSMDRFVEMKTNALLLNENLKKIFRCNFLFYKGF